MKKSILSFLITLFIGGQWCQAQSYIASAIEKTDKEAMQYEVLGKVGSHYWIFKNVLVLLHKQIGCPVSQF